MKLSVAEFAILIVGIAVVAPILAALLSPSTDAISMGLVWLGATAAILIGFFLVRHLPRRH